MTSKCAKPALRYFQEIGGQYQWKLLLAVFTCLTSGGYLIHKLGTTQLTKLMSIFALFLLYMMTESPTFNGGEEYLVRVQKTY